jgi:Fic family protein
MPFVVKEDKHRALYKHITNRNLLWQYDFLLQSIRLGLNQMAPEQPRLTGGLILSLNHFAVVNLTPRPGMLRDDHVHIRNSPHEPPGEAAAEKYFYELIAQTRQTWDDADPLELACRVMWRLTGIHPFGEGNGRTARAVCYYILCLKLNMVLPGRNIIPQQMRDEPAPYYAALRHADATETMGGGADLKPLVDYVARLLMTQLQS